jgi:hypothetical protein
MVPNFFECPGSTRARGRESGSLSRAMPVENPADVNACLTVVFSSAASIADKSTRRDDRRAAKMTRLTRALGACYRAS